MDTLRYIAKKYNLNVKRKKGIDIPNMGRADLAKLLPELGFKTLVEVGVERGIYSEILAKANPQATLYAIDPWLRYKGYRDHVTQKKMDELFDEAKKRLEPYSVMIKQGTSMEVVHQFDDESIDFVYIDGNHEFQHVADDISAWHKKVRVGGIVAGHDYIKRKRDEYLMHVPYVLNAYMESWYYWPLFLVGRREPRKGEVRDKPRSWFYVKQPPRSVQPHRG